MKSSFHLKIIKISALISLLTLQGCATLSGMGEDIDGLFRDDDEMQQTAQATVPVNQSITLAEFEDARPGQAVNSIGKRWRVTSIYQAATNEECKRLKLVTMDKEELISTVCRNKAGWYFVRDVVNPPVDKCKY